MNRSELEQKIKDLSGEPDSARVSSVISSAIDVTHDDVMSLGVWWFQFSREKNVISVPAYQGYVQIPTDFVAPLFVAVKEKQSYDSIADGEWHSLPTTAINEKYLKWARLRRISQDEAMSRHVIVNRNVALTSTTAASLTTDVPTHYWSDERDYHFYPIPDAEIYVWFAYFRRLPYLTGDEDHNHISDYHSNVYVYGALREIFTMQDKSRAVMDAERRYGQAVNIMAKENKRRCADLEKEFQVSISSARGIATNYKTAFGHGRWT